MANFIEVFNYVLTDVKILLTGLAVEGRESNAIHGLLNFYALAIMF